MAIIQPSELKIGDTIRFRSMSPHDNVLWYGKISSICDYKIAKNFDDVDQYYQDVQREMRNLKAKESLSYILLEVMENQAIQTVRAFATEWIDLTTLERVMENTYVDIRVYDIEAEKITDIMRMLKANGYIADVIDTSTLNQVI